MCGPADEVLGLHLRSGHTDLDDAAFGIELGPERAVALLDPTGGAVDAEADGDQVVLVAGFHEHVPELEPRFHRHVELPTEVADVGYAGGENLERTDFDGPGRPEPEPLVGDIGTGELAEDVAARGPTVRSSSTNS